MKVFLLVMLALVSWTAQAQTAARVLVGYPPGGAIDALGRIYSERLAEALGRPFVVETRTGASGQIAASALKASPADGGSLMVVPDSAITLYPHTVKKPAYDTLNDFVPVAHVGSSDIGLAVGPNVTAKDLKEWTEWAKTDSRNAVYGSPGSGTNMHFLGLMLAQATGVELVHLPYRGVGPALADLLGGQVHTVMLPLAQLVQQAKSGRIRILGHAGVRRAPIAPEILTFKELGYPTLEVTNWYLIIAPAGTPAPVVNRYNEIIVQSQRTAQVRERMRGLDLEIQEMAPGEIAAKLTAEHARWAPIVKASGFSADSQ
jgi:tripartite-type tricarboxylate transporter receptor subunit TctC